MKKSKSFWRALLFLVLSAALCGSLALPVMNASVNAAPQMQVISHIVISQIYGGGGNTGAPYQNDYVELFNPSDSPVSVNGWSIQYTGVTGTTWQVTNLGGSLAPGQYYLIQEAAGSRTAPALPTPDATGSIAMAVSAGKVALVNTTTALSGSGCPLDASVVDFVGYGTTANCSEGNGPAPAPSNTAADLRQGNGCADTDDNSVDFTAGTPNPRNNASSAFSCTRITDVTSSTGNGTYTAGDTIAIEVSFSDAVNVTGAPRLLLETGATDEFATYASGSGTNSLSFSYLVVAGDSSSDLDYVSTNSLELNGGTIKDSVGDVNLVLPTPGSPGSLGANRNIVIDNGLPPTVTVNQDSAQADPTSALPVKFAVVFSEPITASSFTAADITQTGTASGITWTITDSGNHKNFVLQAVGIANAGTLIPSIAAGKVTDLAGNSNAASTSTDNKVTYSTTSSPLVLINEVAWSGTSANTSDEWIELYNPGSSAVDITGWKLYGDDNTLNKVGSPNITLAGAIPAKGYFLLERDQQATDVTANQVDSSINLLNTGERLYLKDNAGKTIDTANLDGGAWPAGTATTTTTSPPAYASMERVGTTGNLWVTYQGTIAVAHNRTGGDIKGTPGEGNWINTASVTTINSDLPDPSYVNSSVTVRVTVVGGTTTPTGTVTVTAANSASCTITLASGTGSCILRFTTAGTKTISAVYHSTSGLPLSIDTESHIVIGSGTIYRTPTPIAPPPPQLVVINEFVPRPGHDWNQDGVVNVGDEYIELLNHGTVDVNLSGWRLDDEVNVGSNPYSLPAKTIKPGERIVFYGSDTGLLLGDGGDAVRLLKPNGQLIDAYNYTVARYPDESFCRLPDNGGADDWNQFCFPTPGIKNSLSGNFASPSTSVTSNQPSCPISDTLPEDFVQAECDPFGNNIWSPEFWDRTGWYDEKNLPSMDGKWPVFAD